MGSVCSTQMIPVIKVDKGDSKSDLNQRDKRKMKVLEKELTSSEDNQSKKEKVPWVPPDPTPMPKGIVLTPEPSRLTVEENGARLNVGTRTSGSDALSPSGSSLRSSTDCSVASSGRSYQVQDRGIAPPRLLSLSDDLHQLLMGRLEDTSRIQSRPKVVHLQLIAPSDDCTMERWSLWQHTFAPLRKACAEKGYYLDLHDDLWSPHLTPNSPFCQPFQGHPLTVGGDCLDVDESDIVVIILTEDNTYILPDHFSTQEFRTLQESLQGSDAPGGFLHLLNSLYTNSLEGKDPNKFWLHRQEAGQLNKQKVSRLVTHMISSLQTKRMDTHRFLSPFYLKLKAVSSNLSLLGKRTVVVSRMFSHIMNFDATSGYEFDLTEATEDQGELTRIRSGVEKGCDPSRRVKLELPRGDSKFCREKDVSIVYLKEMGVSVGRLVKAVLDSVVADREAEQRNAVTGVSQSLIDELVTQAKRSRSLTQVQPMFFSTTLRSLQEYVVNFTEMPIVVYAPPGWGLSTLGAQLAEFCKKEIPNALVLFRYLGVSPDTMTLQSTLLSLHQQLDTVLGNRGQWEEDIKTFPTKRLLSDIVSRSTAHLPIIIFLEGVTMATSKLKELEVMTLSDSLPPTTKLIVMTNDAAVTRGLRLKMKDAFYVKAVPWEKQLIADLFSKSMSDRSSSYVLTDSQTTAIANAIKQCPLPLFAVTAAQTVHVLSQTGQIAQIGHIFSGLQHNFPSSVEGIVNKLFDVAENAFPPTCFQWMMAYLCVSVGGGTSWEINDLLSTNDSVLQSVFKLSSKEQQQQQRQQQQKQVQRQQKQQHQQSPSSPSSSSSSTSPPILSRSPTNLWKSFLHVLNPFLRDFVSINYSTKSWTSSTLYRHACERYIRNNAGLSETLQQDMCDYFQGKWANTKKPFSGSTPDERSGNCSVGGVEFSSERYAPAQPMKCGSKLNVRKLLCLPHHAMLHDTKSGTAVEKFILNLPWVVRKLDGVSCLQVLIDLDQAKAMAYSHAHPNDLDAIQAVVFKSINSLTMCGKELNKILQQSVISSKYKAKKELYKDSVYYNSTSYYKMIQSIEIIPFSYLSPVDKERTSLPQLSPIPTPMINDIVPTHTESHFVATVLKLEGEIRIVDTKTNTVVRTLKGLDRPTTLMMLDRVTAVVLCNRELYIIDLDQGTVVNKLRTVLNLRKPLFALQNQERVVVLSRDRMLVNVIDIKTGAIVSSFKAGETRFLESLLVSGDGKMLVCGDETQKPYPLLAWSLEQGKLVHDIRMSQHEFLTDLADITHDGRYLACGCKEVSASDSNFIVVYDLVTGQLLKKFKMAGVVTALVIASKSLSVIAALDTAQVVVWDIVSGDRRLVLEGAHASVDKLQLSMDGRRCLTSCSKEYAISAHTLSLWDIDEGRLLGTHTFHSQTTCAYLSWDGQTVLAGVWGHTEPIRLNLVQPRGKQQNKNNNSSSSSSSNSTKQQQQLQEQHVASSDGNQQQQQQQQHQEQHPHHPPDAAAHPAHQSVSKNSKSDEGFLQEQFGSSARSGNIIQVFNA